MSLDDSRKSEGKANEESPILLLQSKAKERHLVINFDIKGKFTSGPSVER